MKSSAIERERERERDNVTSKFWERAPATMAVGCNVVDEFLIFLW